MKKSIINTTIAFIILILTPAFAGNENKSENINKPKTTNNIVEILSSVPVGYPIDEEYIKINIDHLSGYGHRMHPVFLVRKLHEGIDFPAKYGTPVTSTSYGYVHMITNSKSGFGKCVIIKSGDYFIYYGHLSEILVKTGDRVSKDDIIGKVGSSGISTGPHLHYGIKINNKFIDPYPFI